MLVKHVTALGAGFNHDHARYPNRPPPLLPHSFSSRVMARNKDARNEEWNEEQR